MWWFAQIESSMKINRIKMKWVYSILVTTKTYWKEITNEHEKYNNKKLFNFTWEALIVFRWSCLGGLFVKFFSHFTLFPLTYSFGKGKNEGKYFEGRFLEETFWGKLFQRRYFKGKNLRETLWRKNF